MKEDEYVWLYLIGFEMLWVMSCYALYRGYLITGTIGISVLLGMISYWRDHRVFYSMASGISFKKNRELINDRLERLESKKK